MSTWYSKHVEESNNIWRINNIQCITLVVLYGQFHLSLVMSIIFSSSHYDVINIPCICIQICSVWALVWLSDHLLRGFAQYPHVNAGSLPSNVLWRPPSKSVINHTSTLSPTPSLQTTSLHCLRINYWNFSITASRPGMTSVSLVLI